MAEHWFNALDFVVERPEFLNWLSCLKTEVMQDFIYWILIKFYISLFDETS